MVEAEPNVETEIAFIELALRVHNVTADSDAIDRISRMLEGRLTRSEAIAEIRAKYDRLRSER